MLSSWSNALELESHPVPFWSCKVGILELHATAIIHFGGEIGVHTPDYILHGCIMVRLVINTYRGLGGGERKKKKRKKKKEK